MRSSLKIAIVCLAVALIGVTASIYGSDGYSDGYVENGYTYRNGYWYMGDQAYTRTKVFNQGYYSRGCYYNGYWSYTYTPYYAPKSYESALPSYTDNNWRTKLLEIAQQRDKYEGQQRAKALDQQQYLEAVEALGLKNNFTWHGYGAAPPYSSYGYGNKVQSLGAYGANGATAYGYSVNSIADVYGSADLNTLYQQASRLTENAQQLAGQANTDFSTLVTKEGDNRSRVANILAKGQVVQEALRAMNEPSARIESKTFSFNATVGPDGKMKVVPTDPTAGADPNAAAGAGTPAPAPAGDSFAQFSNLVNQKCMSCHSPQKKDGGFDVSVYPQMSMQQKQKVWSRLLTTDPGKLMPKGANGSPSHPLNPDEVRLFLNN